MDIVSKQELIQLIKDEENPSVSIFLPTYEEWTQMDQDKIRYKNALANAKKQLSENKYEINLNQFMEKAEDLLDDKNFYVYCKSN